MIDRVQGHPLKTPEIVDLRMQIADALDAVHAKGILRRDIKPENIGAILARAAAVWRRCERRAGRRSRPWPSERNSR
jgi:hypothetical protein